MNPKEASNRAVEADPESLDIGPPVNWPPKYIALDALTFESLIRRCSVRVCPSLNRPGYSRRNHSNSVLASRPGLSSICFSTAILDGHTSCRRAGVLIVQSASRRPNCRQTNFATEPQAVIEAARTGPLSMGCTYGRSALRDGSVPAGLHGRRPAAMAIGGHLTKVRQSETRSRPPFGHPDVERPPMCSVQVVNQSRRAYLGGRRRSDLWRPLRL